jgi:hypothetical protein
MTAPDEWVPRAPRWVWSCALDPGAWRVLMGLWSFTRGNADGECVVFPTRAKLAKAIGLTTRAVRIQLVKLRALGWIRDEPEHEFSNLAIRLAWVSPVQAWADAAQTDGSTVPVSGTDEPHDGMPDPVCGTPMQAEHLCPTSGTPVSDERNTCVRRAEQVITQNCKGTSQKNQPEEPASPARPDAVAAKPKARRNRASPAQPSLPMPGADPPADSAPPPKPDGLPEITAWWARFNAIRKAEYQRWHNADARDIQLTPDRIRDLRARLAEHEPRRPIAIQLAAADHVLAVIVAWVGRDRGRPVPRKDGPAYDSMKRLSPDYWLRSDNFRKHIEDDLPREQPATESSFERMPYTPPSYYAGEMDHHQQEESP